MNLLYKVKQVILIISIILIPSLLGGEMFAASQEDNPVLIISSYNPETPQTAKNISAFLEEYKKLGGTTVPVVIENMNCNSFSDALIWKPQMTNLLLKYTHKNKPRVIIILGQEAWASYISQEDSALKSTPVICGMVSRNAIVLPKKEIPLSDFEPQSVDVFKDIKGVNVLGGYAFEYDVKKNVDLIKSFFPDTKHIAFISDNSYGGVSLQAYVKKEFKKFPELDLILLDGRKQTIYTLGDSIRNLPKQTVILLGTWRVDKNDGYFMRNATYSMMEANPEIPTFSLTSLGMGHWPIGGYMPEYRTIGEDIARQTVDILRKKEKSKVHIQFIANQYSFDVKQLDHFKLNQKVLPKGSELVNEDISFFDQYKYFIFATILAFIFLLIGYLVTLFFFVRTKRLKDELEVSEAELRVAKDKAEESNRLKTAFLANISHEIRTPLNAIVGFSNVLAEGESTDEEEKKYYEIIQTNSDMLLRLINDILDISRLEANRLNFTYEKCELTSFCQKAIASFEYSNKGNVKYIFNPSYQHFELNTDAERLKQILINLLSNASKFTDEGTITLDFSVDKKRNMVYFSVTDTGCGIPLDKQTLVFDRFEKLNDYAQGTGLGLSICKLTIQKLGGDIWIDHDYKDGSRFVFSHPLNT